jgi:hypothetical protein
MLGRDGAITAVRGDSESVIGRVTPLFGSRNPFACNDRYIFQSGDAFGQVVIERLSLEGDTEEVRLRLIGGGPGTMHGQFYPHVFGGVDILALVADGDGVWLVSDSGTEEFDGQPAASAYPSLLHITFSPHRERTPVD